MAALAWRVTGVVLVPLLAASAGGAAWMVTESTMVRAGVLGLTSASGAAGMAHGMTHCGRLTVAFGGSSCALTRAKLEAVSASHAVC